MTSPPSSRDALALLPPCAWRFVLACLAPLERACVHRATEGDRCFLLLHPHVADARDASSQRHEVQNNGTTHQVALSSRAGADRDGLTCLPDDSAFAANGEPLRHVLLTGIDAALAPRVVAPARGGRDARVDFSLHNSFGEETDDMSARQILPQAADAGRPSAKQPSSHSSKQTGELVAAPAAGGSSSSTLAMLFRRLAHIRRRRTTNQTPPHLQIQQRNSWPTTGRRRESASLARRAHQSLVSAWASLQRESSATKTKALTPPQFLLRTQRRLSQRFNLKIVQAVGKDVRRSESQRRNSLTLLDAPRGLSRASSASDFTDDVNDFPLRLSERLSLTLGRKLSRDFMPMLTEGSALECRVRELVYGLLRDSETFEGHICASFFTKQEAFALSTPAACRYYLGCVRDTISDLVQFMGEYRLRALGDEFLPFFEPNNTTTSNQDQDHDAAFALAMQTAVRRAIEEYFCFSLRYELRQWCAGAAAETLGGARASQFRKTLARWSELPPTSHVFGLKRGDPQLATQLLVATAIAKLQALEPCATPSRKMELLLGACHALSEFIARQSQHSTTLTDGESGLPLLPPLSPTSRVCLGDADAFLPLLIFAVSRSHLRDAFAQCALLHGLYPFASQHGERMYYLTMFEAALEFIRTHS